MPPRAVRAPTVWLVPTSPPLAAACCPVCTPQPVMETAVGQAFATFLRLEVAQGAASPDTQRGYWSQVRAWAAWCQAQACCLATAPATAGRRSEHQSVPAAAPRSDRPSAASPHHGYTSRAPAPCSRAGHPCVPDPTPAQG